MGTALPFPWTEALTWLCPCQQETFPQGFTNSGFLYFLQCPYQMQDTHLLGYWLLFCSEEANVGSVHLQSFLLKR